jgi:dTDP-4-dehydrorhamnose 3,5-epimerase
VVVDLRRNEATFGKAFSLELSGENRKQLFVPKGFAHGFSVLSKNAEVMYKCDEYYKPEYERGINHNDPELKIDWGLQPTQMIISEKDKALPMMSVMGHAFETVH